MMSEPGTLRYGCCEVCLERGKVLPLTPDDPTYHVCRECYITYVLYRIQHIGLVLARHGRGLPSTGLWSVALLSGTSSISSHY